MFYNNPFGSWTDGKSNSASVFGALPYPTEANLVQFFFTNYNPNIFNASVYGPNAQLYYRVVTDNQMPGYTVIKDAQGQNLTLIEWQQHPFVEVRGSLSKRSVAQWLPLSPNQEYVLLRYFLAQTYPHGLTIHNSFQWSRYGSQRDETTLGSS
ncbi:hypothetical protein BKA70DRAFT_1175220 [Coprinopsis sp. MPI-PUGE-AT-0042]|nr:hypothetical protein BKA70DRAFT_1175220 [Coprinopsis sp. MPI-PUGE-AT-0042]